MNIPLLIEASLFRCARSDLDEIPIYQITQIDFDAGVLKFRRGRFKATEKGGVFTPDHTEKEEKK